MRTIVVRGVYTYVYYCNWFTEACIIRIPVNIMLPLRAVTVRVHIHGTLRLGFGQTRKYNYFDTISKSRRYHILYKTCIMHTINNTIVDHEFKYTTRNIQWRYCMIIYIIESSLKLIINQTTQIWIISYIVSVKLRRILKRRTNYRYISQIIFVYKKNGPDKQRSPLLYSHIISIMRELSAEDIWYQTKNNPRPNVVINHVRRLCWEP